MTRALCGEVVRALALFQRSVVRAPAQEIFHSKKTSALAIRYILVVFLYGVVLRRIRYGSVRRVRILLIELYDVLW